MAKPKNICTVYFKENGINYDGNETRFYMDDYISVPIHDTDKWEKFSVQLRHIYDPDHPYGGVCLLASVNRPIKDDDGWILACAVECSPKDLYSREIGRDLVGKLFSRLVNFMDKHENYDREHPCLNYREHAVFGLIRMDDPEGATCGNDFMDEVAYLLCPSAYHKYL